MPLGKIFSAATSNAIFWQITLAPRRWRGRAGEQLGQNFGPNYNFAPFARSLIRGKLSGSLLTSQRCECGSRAFEGIQALE